MNIYMVKTCDGPMFFFKSHVTKAIDMAKNQVLYNNIHGYDDNTRTEVALCQTKKELLQILMEHGVVQEVTIH